MAVCIIIAKIALCRRSLPMEEKATGAENYTAINRFRHITGGI
jgi:hypothetical protein